MPVIFFVCHFDLICHEICTRTAKFSYRTKQNTRRIIGESYLQITKVQAFLFENCSRKNLKKILLRRFFKKIAVLFFLREKDNFVSVEPKH